MDETVRAGLLVDPWVLEISSTHSIVERRAGMNQHLRADRLTDEFSNHGTFNLEQEKDITRFTAESLKVALSLCNNQIHSRKSITQRLIAVCQNGAWSV
jgi:hypothetical protein